MPRLPEATRPSAQAPPAIVTSGRSEAVRVELPGPTLHGNSPQAAVSPTPRTAQVQVAQSLLLRLLSRKPAPNTTNQTF